MGSWGSALVLGERPLEAEHVLRRAIAIGQGAEAGVPAGVLLTYARALRDVGRLDEAADYVERAYAKAQTSSDLLLRWALFTRTDIYTRQGDLERATQTLSELESMLRRNLLAGGNISFAWLASRQALIAKARGDPQTALDLANQAVAIMEASIKDGREGGVIELPNLLVRRADIHRQLGHKDEAEGDARRALKMLLEAAQPGMFSISLGRAYVALGRALQAQGKHEEASLAFRSAVEHLQSALGPDSAETRAARQLAEPEIHVR